MNFVVAKIDAGPFRGFYTVMNGIPAGTYSASCDSVADFQRELLRSNPLPSGRRREWRIFGVTTGSE